MLKIVNGVLYAALLTVGMLVVMMLVGPIKFAATTRPITQGYVASLINLKETAAASISTRKMVIVSGSGGLFGLRCEVLTKETGLPCVNGGLPIELGSGSIIAFGKKILRNGDVAIIPFEYGFFYYPHVSGSGLTAEKLFAINFDYFTNAVAERLIVWLKDEKQSIIGIITPTGDRMAHTAALASSFEEKRRNERLYFNSSCSISPQFALQIREFASWAKSHQIKLVASVQPTYDDSALSVACRKQIANFYKNIEIPLVVDETWFGYPRHMFWDSYDHLNEEAQLMHSAKLGRLLKEQLH